VIPALVAALSACGLTATWALLRPLKLARDVQLQADDPAIVAFGFDSVGLVD
jgi:hypothetical protein